MNVFGGSDRKYGEVKLQDSKGSKGGAKGATISIISGGKKGSTKDIIVTSITADVSEKYAALACFNDKNHIYAFGHDAQQSMMRVTCITNVDDQKCSKNGYKKAIEAYKKNRLSKDKVVTVTLGKQTWSGRIISMSTDTYSQELNLQAVTYTILLPEA